MMATCFFKVRLLINVTHAGREELPGEEVFWRTLLTESVKDSFFSVKTPPAQTIELVSVDTNASHGSLPIRLANWVCFEVHQTSERKGFKIEAKLYHLKTIG
jgi:hypothetical protein